VFIRGVAPGSVSVKSSAYFRASDAGAREANQLSEQLRARPSTVFSAAFLEGKGLVTSVTGSVQVTTDLPPSLP
jgi:hypothetical protein